MSPNRKTIIAIVITALITAVLFSYQLPYYVYKPGTAEALDPVIEVDGGYASEGDMHLVTIRGGQATAVQWLLTQFRPYYELMPLDEVRPEGVSEQEYFHAQLQMMETSQEAAQVVAYEAAGKQIDIQYDGVYVMQLVKGMPAADRLQSGDRIVEVDGQEVKESSDLINYVENKKAGESVSLLIEREKGTLTREVELAPFPDNEEKVGIGISLVTDRSVEVDPEVSVESGEIGGPSAGLMFSLEIYDQLTEYDLTSGKEIAGTGEINYDGEVGKIGGIDKKVVAADEEGASVFFAPNEEGAEDSNYKIAAQTAEDIGTDMEIVPVDTFQEAVDYLKKNK
ncbi:SepM family pheromone-processing serine protease [Salimicrobium salexigens]|uniref:endopeptidase La n=1 Tax=Salimicrobium salexigens TaxID=908941 RepID=A0ABY1KPL9_9BACI|nr:SepM family pheromone-processing serine protease [Salimicrobium salexigens]SIS61310.1 PDZ domain-containing protein [Salimicrobium salexigens]